MTGALLFLGNRVRARREELGLSQEALADLCSFDRTYVSMIERGKRNISLLNLVRIAKGLSTSVAQLTEGIEDGAYTKR